MGGITLGYPRRVRGFSENDSLNGGFSPWSCVPCESPCCQCCPGIETHVRCVHLKILIHWINPLWYSVCAYMFLYSSGAQQSGGSDFFFPSFLLVFFFPKQFDKWISLWRKRKKSTFLLASTAGVTLQQPDDGGVVLCPLNKLLQRQFTWRKTHILKQN